MAKISKRQTSPAKKQIWPGLFSGLTGIFFAVALLKFGNPVIFNDKIAEPTDIYELIFQPWPTKWGYAFIAILAVVGIKIAKWNFSPNRKSVFWLLLPLVWLAWQFVSATKTVDLALTQSAVKHFVICVASFYLGWFCLSQIQNFRPLFFGLLLGFGLVVITGLQQHFGGLEETRQFFYQQPDWREYPPEFLKKVSSTRIFSTLFYPNTLAAAILLFLPISIIGLWALSSRASFAMRCSLVGLLSFSALACLFWSGSKSGWLLLLLLGLVSLLQLRFSPVVKKWLVLSLLLLGLGGFAVKYAAFFQRGATSVVARFDYWRAALEITKQNPLLGTGPGTFFIPYQKIKAPEAEMARLCHNDYIEQASDSGLVGFLSFTTLIFGSLAILRKPKGNLPDPFRFCVWLGVAGISLHSLVEFNFYIPAIAWPTFLLLGWLWGTHAQETIRQGLPGFVSSSR